jgi:uncharacterized DUF497 family protein
MEFEWDEAKRRLNFKKHGIDFEDVIPAFNSPMHTGLATREDNGEDRWIGIGLVRNIVVGFAFTERGNDSFRIISARKAMKYEREAYFKKVKNELG